MVGGFRREVHEGHGLDGNIGSEFLVGGVREISEETEEVVSSRAVGLSEGREVPLASDLLLGLE